MVRILEQRHISLPKVTSKTGPESKNDDNERFHAPKDGFSKYQAFLIDLGATNHIVSSKESFYSLNLIDSPSIHMGDDTQF